jgi:hypothetical protein
MTVTYSTPGLLPFVCAIYVCRCGATAERHGRQATEPPPGWVVVSEDVHVCPDCVRAGAGA